MEFLSGFETGEAAAQSPDRLLRKTEVGLAYISVAPDSEVGCFTVVSRA